jgi:predicted HicB family RNase H-like nuclease
MMEHKGYMAQIDYDDDARAFHGEVITFEGTCVEDLRQAFIDSVEDYLVFYRERGEKPEKPFSGNFMVRIKPELHQKVALKAKIEDKSMNNWIDDFLEKAVR